MTTAKPSSLSIWGYCCFAALVGRLVLTLVETSTLEFWNIGIFPRLFSGLGMAASYLAGTSFGFLVYLWFVNRSNRTLTEKRHISMTFWLSWITFNCLFSVISSATPKHRFREEVMNPLPDSVKEVKVAGLDTTRLRRWMFHFRIDPYEVSKIVWRHGLTQAPVFDFQKMIDQDPVLREVSWARDIHYRDTALFYVNAYIEDSENGPSYAWTFLMVDAQSSTAWFITGYQR
ncbi:hypothetical protein BH11VER1_BH11VER1_04830 [soil metagenome]